MYSYRAKGGAAAFVVAILGFHMVLSSWPRLGSTPYCKKCGHNLNGFKGTLCPECDYDFHTHGYRVGEREFLVWRFVLGLLMFLVGGGMAFATYYCWDPDRGI